VIGCEVRRPPRLHPSQPRKEGVVVVSSQGLGIDQHDANPPAVQEAVMLGRKIDDAIMGNSLKFYCIHQPTEPVLAKQRVPLGQDSNMSGP
jgi:hypothetical protein